MTEYKYVSLPSTGKEIRSERVDEFASSELNSVWVSDGWEVVNATRPAPIGPIGFLLRRDL
jgi:hypothetical protein